MRELPDGWRRVALRDITEERVEKVGRRRQITVLSSTKHHGLVPSEEYFRGRKIYSSDLAGYALVKRDWFAYATNHLSEGSIGLQDAFDLACVSPIYTVFSCTEGVYPSYLARVLKSDEVMAKYRVYEHASVDRRGAIRYKDFGKIEINLPSERDQRQIVEVLDTIDSAIVNQAEIIRKVKAVSTSLLNKYLANVIAESEATQLLVSLASIASGVTLGTETGGSIVVPYLRVANVQDGYIDTTEMKNIRVGRAECRRYLLERGDVLLTEGGDFDKLGRGAVWDGRVNPCIYQNHLFRVRTDRSQLLPEYLSAFCSSNEGRRYFLSIAKQTTNLATINSSQLKEMPIPVPRLEVQRELAAVAASGERRMSLEVERLTHLERVRHGLVDDLLSGQVRMGEVAAAV